MRLKRIVFGIGSNVGDREFYLNQAVNLLERDLELSSLKRSNIFKNQAMLLPNSPLEWDVEFFNIAVSGDVDLEKNSPQKILEITQKIEKKIGRKNRGRWAPREIDIDILIIDGLALKIENQLEIPHPGILSRDFFIKTVAEIELKLLESLINSSAVETCF